MTAFNEEVSSAEKIGLHLSEIGRIQNNAGAIMQFMAVVFAVCVYFYNALVYPPEAPHKALFGLMLALDGLFIVVACFLYLRCLTLSVGWSKQIKSQRSFHFLSALPEEDVEKTLFWIVRSFRRGTYCFFLVFFTTAVLIVLVALGESNMLP